MESIGDQTPQPEKPKRGLKEVFLDFLATLRVAKAETKKHTGQQAEAIAEGLKGATPDEIADIQQGIDRQSQASAGKSDEPSSQPPPQEQPK